MRLDKPVGILLLMWPTLWALFIASQGFPDMGILIIFVLGVIFMRSAGCIVNDILDRKYDILVDRTKNRPIASGKISVKLASIYSIILCLIAFVVLINFNLNKFSNPPGP